MRRLLLLLLVVLMPIRVLGADFMVLAMAKHASPQQASMGFADMPADCPMMADYLAQKGADPEGQGQDQRQSCDACMPFATPTSMGVVPAQRPVSMALHGPMTYFRSADTDRELRPPIS